jgi:hypothetical protein
MLTELVSILVTLVGTGLYNLQRWLRNLSARGITPRKALRLFVQRCRLKSEIRFSASVLLLLRSKTNDDHFLLIQGGSQERRYWSPVGGVLKFFPSRVESHFRELQVTLDRNVGLGDGLVDDIRLLLPGRQAFKLLRWFNTDQGRESIDQAMIREMYEELRPIGDELKDESRDLENELLHLLPVIGFEEAFPEPIVEIGRGPVFAGGGEEFFNVRLFYVVSVVREVEFRQWIERALDTYLGHRCCWVTSDEMRSLSTIDFIPVSGHSCALLGLAPNTRRMRQTSAKSSGTDT